MDRAQFVETAARGAHFRENFVEILGERPYGKQRKKGDANYSESHEVMVASG
jgi:hypothetical protein